MIYAYTMLTLLIAISFVMTMVFIYADSTNNR